MADNNKRDSSKKSAKNKTKRRKLADDTVALPSTSYKDDLSEGSSSEVESQSSDAIDESSSEDEEHDISNLKQEEVNLEFEGFAVESDDFQGIKAFLKQLFVMLPMNISSLADAITTQSYLGSTLKMTDDEEGTVYGITTLLDLTKETEFRQELYKSILQKCKEAEIDKVKRLEELLSNDLGFLINERFINIPAEVSVPMYTSLQMEMKEAISMKQFNKIDYVLFIAKSVKTNDNSESNDMNDDKASLKMSHGNKRKKTRQKNDMLQFINAEDEIFYKESCFSFSYSVTKSTGFAVSGNWDVSDNTMNTFRTVVVCYAATLILRFHSVASLFLSFPEEANDIMEACQAVEREISKLLLRYETLEDNYSKLDDLIQHIEDINKGLCQAPSDSALSPLQSHIITACGKKVKDGIQRFSTEHKELHSCVSKVGKAVDRNFVSDFTGTTQEGIFDGEESRFLTEAICEHLLRKGPVFVADMLIQEASLQIEEKQKEPFAELNRILDECKNHNLEPALKWVESKRDELDAKNSPLEFKLHRLKFIDLIVKGDCTEALAYSKNFSRFRDNLKEIQKLMACFAFVKVGLENSPYAELLDSINWLEINDILAKEACTLMGLSVSSPLEVSVTAGCVALPTLLQIKQVMKQRQCSGVWSSKEELPVEIEVGDEYRFHSIFACPILRQQCGRTNPPMRLICGHAISKDALNKLVGGNKLKCPYCPMEMDPQHAQQLRF
eukprot:gene5489-6174_t